MNHRQAIWEKKNFGLVHGQVKKDENESRETGSDKFFWYQGVHKRLIALVRKQNWNKESSQEMIQHKKWYNTRNENTKRLSDSPSDKDRQKRGVQGCKESRVSLEKNCIVAFNLRPIVTPPQLLPLPACLACLSEFFYIHYALYDDISPSFELVTILDDPFS